MNKLLIVLIVVLSCSPSRKNDMSLIEAIEMSRIDIVKTHITTGTNLNAINDDEPFLWWKVSWHGNGEIATILLQGGADANLRDSIGITPLHYAALCNNNEVAEVLIKAGADINALTPSGETPMHFAALHGSAEVGRFLLQHGANPSPMDECGKTPLDYAAPDHPEIGMLLGKPNKALPREVESRIIFEKVFRGELPYMDKNITYFLELNGKDPDEELIKKLQLLYEGKLKPISLAKYEDKIIIDSETGKWADRLYVELDWVNDFEAKIAVGRVPGPLSGLGYEGIVKKFYGCWFITEESSWLS